MQRKMKTRFFRLFMALALLMTPIAAIFSGDLVKAVDMPGPNGYNTGTTGPAATGNGTQGQGSPAATGNGSQGQGHYVISGSGKKKPKKNKQTGTHAGNKNNTGTHSGGGGNSQTDKDVKNDNEDSDKDSDFGDLSIPSRLATAFAQGYDKATSDGQSDALKKGSSTKTTGDSDAIQTVQKNISALLDAGFYNVGALYGAVGLKGSSATNNVVQLPQADKPFMRAYLHGTGGNGKMDGFAYYNFGRAWDDMAKKAEAIPPNASGGDEAGQALSNAIGKVAKMGLSLLNNFSPAPIALAFYDARELTNNHFHKPNYIVSAIQRNTTIMEVLQFFGGPAPAPLSVMSNSEMIILTILVIDFALSALMLFFNEASFSRYLRKAALKIVVIAAAVPLSMKLYSWALGGLDAVVGQENESIQNKMLEQNLGMALWADSRFALPKGVTLVVKDGQFQFDSSQVKAININSARLTGKISASEAGNVTQKVADKIVDAMSEAGDRNNQSSMQWNNVLRRGTNTPYYTDGLNEIADNVGKNSKIKKDDVAKVGYLSEAGGMTYTSDGSENGTYQYHTSSPDAYGFAPIAAYNFLNTNFTNNGISVISNIKPPVYPTVAVNANLYGMQTVKSIKENGDIMRVHPDPLVNFILNLVAMYFGLKAMVTILVGAFGGMIRGSGQSVFGSAEGWGRLIGGVIALVGGMMGISLLISIISSLISAAYGIVLQFISIIPGLNGLQKGMNQLQSAVSGWPFIGGMLNAALNTVETFVSDAIALIFGIPLMKVPLTAFGEYASGFPDMMADRASAMEARILGGYRGAGHGGGGGMGSKLAAAAHSNASGIKQGLSMAAGGAISNFLHDNNNSQSQSNTDNKTDQGKDGDNKASKQDSMAKLGGSSVKNAANQKNDQNHSDNSSQNDERSANSNNNSENASQDNSQHANDQNSEENQTGDEISSNEDTSVGDPNDNALEGADSDSVADSADVGAPDSDAAGTGDDSVAGDNQAQGDDQAQEGDAGVSEGDQSIDESSMSDDDMSEQSMSDDDMANDQTNVDEGNTDNSENGDSQENKAGDVTDAAENVDENASMNQGGDSSESMDASNKSQQQANDNSARTDAKSSSQSVSSTTGAGIKDSMSQGANAASRDGASAKDSASSAKGEAESKAGDKGIVQAAMKPDDSVSAKTNKLVSGIKSAGTAVGHAAKMTSEGKTDGTTQVVAGLTHAAASSVGARSMTQGLYNSAKTGNSADNAAPISAPTSTYMPSQVDAPQTENPGRKQAAQINAQTVTEQAEQRGKADTNSAQSGPNIKSKVSSIVSNINSK